MKTVPMIKKTLRLILLGISFSLWSVCTQGHATASDVNDAMSGIAVKGAWREAREFKDINDAIASLRISENTSLLIDRAEALTAPLVVPANVTLWFVGKGSIRLGSYDLTIQGALVAEPKKIFHCSEKGRVFLTSAKINSISPEWWGIDGNDDDIAIQAAINSMPDGGTINLLRTTYKTKKKITLKVRTTLKGVGRSIWTADVGSRINYSGVGFALEAQSGSVIQDIDIDSQDNGVILTGSRAVIMHVCIKGKTAKGSVGVQFGGGSLSDAAMYNSVYSAMSRGFKTLLKFMPHSNSNFIYASQLITNLATDRAEADYWIYIDSANGNFIEAGLEGDWDKAGGGALMYFDDSDRAGTYGNEFRGWIEVSNKPKIRFNKGYDNVINSFRQITYDDVEYVSRFSATNKVNYSSNITGLPSSFYHSVTDNLIENAELNYQPNKTLSIIPFGWSIAGANNQSLSDDGTTFYGHKALRVNIKSGGASGLGYKVSPELNDLIKGKTITFVVPVRTTTKGKIKLSIISSEGFSSSAFHSGSGNWEFLKITTYISQANSTIELRIHGYDNAGHWDYYFALPTLIIGSEIQEVKARGLSDSGGTLYGPLINKPVEFRDGDTTPSVKCGTVFKTGNSSGTLITDFTDGADGQSITIVGADGGNTTISHGPGVALSGGKNFRLENNDTLNLVRNGPVWCETSRSKN